MVHSKLICPEDDALVWREAPANRGWDRGVILGLLAADPPQSGGHDLVRWGQCEVVDGSSLSDDARRELYAAALLARPRREIKGVFWGGPGRPIYLGTLVPAFFLYDDEAIYEVYPRDLQELGIITIHDFLTTGRETAAGDVRDEYVYDPEPRY